MLGAYSHIPLTCVSQAAWVPVPLGEGAAGEGAGYLAALSMEEHTPVFSSLSSFHFHFKKYI